jgi:hypothetical protein
VLVISICSSAFSFSFWMPLSLSCKPLGRMKHLTQPMSQKHSGQKVTQSVVMAQTQIDPIRMGVEFCRFAAPRSCCQVLIVLCGRPRVLRSVAAKTLISWASEGVVDPGRRRIFLPSLSSPLSVPHNATSLRWFRMLALEKVEVLITHRIEFTGVYCCKKWPITSVF